MFFTIEFSTIFALVCKSDIYIDLHIFLGYSELLVSSIYALLSINCVFIFYYKEENMNQLLRYVEKDFRVGKQYKASL